MARKMETLSYHSPIFKHGEGTYNNRVLLDNVPGYPGYHITKRGKVYSRWNKHGKTELLQTYHVVKPQFNKSGKPTLKLYQAGIGKKRWLLHRLVAIIYVPNPENLPYVCHKDNIPTHCYASNLYWGTQKDNIGQASKEGRMIKVGTLIQRTYIPKLIKLGFNYKEVSEIMNLNRVTVSNYYKKYLKKYE